jgi:hypothetical protein
MFVYGFYAFALLFAGAVQALTVAPAGAFTARGQLAVSKGRLAATCRATFTGRVDPDGAVSITAVDFGDKPRRCRLLQAQGLPWQGSVGSPVQLRLQGVAVEVDSRLDGGVCGPAVLVAEWRAVTSTLHFPAQPLPRDCSLQGEITTTPALVINP